VPETVLLRLLAALLLGIVVAWIYLRTAKHGDSGASFPITLAMLSVLIAMVTQVIGNNVALAFSLVGALSVVRFRTVVRDTRDTAYVIFAVVVGMAVGSANLWVALAGIAVVGGASWVAARIGWVTEAAPYLLIVRLGPGKDLEAALSSLFGEYLAARDLVAVGTGKQGMGLEYTFEVKPRAGVTMEQLVRAATLTEGVVDVRFQRRELY
jgi:hypothetical protein